MKRIFKPITFLILLIIPCLYFLSSCNFFKQEDKGTPSVRITYKATYETIDVELTFNEDSKSYKFFSLELTQGDDVISKVMYEMDINTHLFEGLTEDTTYNLVVSLSNDSNEYIELTRVSLKTKSKLDASSYVSFKDNTFLYDGKQHTISVSGALSILKNATYTYTCNGEPFYGAIDAGEYLVKCVVTSDNYKTLEVEATLTILKSKLEYKYNFTDVIKDYDGLLYEPEFQYEGLDYMYYNSNGKIVKEIKNVDTYIIHYSFNGDNNYEACQGQYSLTIRKVDIVFKYNSSQNIGDIYKYNITQANFNIPLEFSYTIYDSSKEIVNSFSDINKSGAYTILIYSKETKNHDLFLRAYPIFIGNAVNDSDKILNYVTFDSDIKTISETRKYLLNEAYSNNDISLDIDTSELCNENVNKDIKIYYESGNMKFYRIYNLLDEEAPIIQTTEKARRLSVGESCDLYSFFECYDEVDGVIELNSSNVNLSEVDINNSGTYIIYIDVADKSYNKIHYEYKLYVQAEMSRVSDSVEIKKLSDVKPYPLNTVGNSNILVVPLVLDDSTTADGSNSTAKEYDEETITNLNLAFNGETGQTDFESVKSYYKKSSYGKLNLSFDLVSPVELKYKQSYYDNGEKYFASMIIEALEAIKDDVDFSKYDTNNDTYLDAVWFIYNTKHNSSSSYFWAVTADLDLSTTINGYQLRNFSVASIDFMDSTDSYNSIYTKNTYTNICPRTYIHETGHLLGLEDYYDRRKDLNQSNSSHMYEKDMMDTNILDHNVASKLSFGWINPYLVDSNTTLTLRSASLYGDAILIKKNLSKDKGIYDEYIMLEFINDEGLNSYDYSTAFNTYGIRVLHVNFKLSGNSFAYDNFTSSYNDIVLLETMPYEKPTYKNNKYTGENILFTTPGVVFGQDVYSDFTYSDGTKLDFTFKINQISEDDCTITFNF